MKRPSTKTGLQRGARERRRQIIVRQPPAGVLRSRQEKKDLFEGFNPLND
jgi:hypothetical protein